MFEEDDDNEAEWDWRDLYACENGCCPCCGCSCDDDDEGVTE